MLLHLLLPHCLATARHDPTHMTHDTHDTSARSINA
jgi:hypothetical protein